MTAPIVSFVLQHKANSQITTKASNEVTHAKKKKSAWVVVVVVVCCLFFISKVTSSGRFVSDTEAQTGQHRVHLALTCATKFPVRSGVQSKENTNPAKRNTHTSRRVIPQQRRQQHIARSDEHGRNKTHDCRQQPRKSTDGANVSPHRQESKQHRLYSL